MAEIHAEYDGDLLSAARIEQLHAALESEAAELADLRNEVEAG